MKHAPDDKGGPGSALSRFARAGLVIAVVSLLGLALLLANTTGRAGTRAAGAAPPAGVDVTGAALTGPSAVSVTIPGVPAYIWHHGSGPTAAGMVIGYWDGQGYSDLVPGDASTQTPAVNEVIASEGPASNYTDYCEPRDDGGPPIADLSEPPPGDEHEDECLADYMKTSQSFYTNWYGHSWFTHVGPALRDYVRQVFGPGNYAGVTTNLRALDGSMSWDNLRAEIDAGRPLILLVDETGEGDMRFVTAVGYGTLGQTQRYACYNTIDADLHWYEFALMAPGQPWGISDGVTFQIVTLDNNVFLPLVMRN